MAGNLRRLVPGVGILCFLMFFSGQNSLGSQSASDDHTASSGFVIPKKTRSVLTSDEMKGKMLYSYYCTICHGNTGKGDGFNSYILSTHPRNFTDTARMTALSDSQIQKVVLNGGRAQGESPEMPAWGGVLTEKQAAELTSFIRTFARENDEKK